jgi:predicted MPP superfamily phosphohydrolase
MSIAHSRAHSGALPAFEDILAGDPPSESQSGWFADGVAGNPYPSVKPKNRPPLPLVPLHRLWRRTIDQVEVCRVALPVRNLPKGLSGLTACQISDFHLDREEDLTRLERAVETINRQRPDMVFLTGDYFSDAQAMRRHLGGFRERLADLRANLGVFAVAGNHDHWASFALIEQALRGAGVRVLANESVRLTLPGGDLMVVGIDDLWSRRAEPSRAFREITPDDCTIVLAHNPDTAAYLNAFNVGVMLSGHTHGGVVRIPFYGSPLRSILRIGKEYYAGLNRYNEFYIYTNRGLGTFWLRIRLNCRPEIAHFSLTEAHPASAAAAAVAPKRVRRSRRRRTLEA